MIKNWKVLERELEKDYRIFQVENRKALSPRTGKTLDIKAICFPPWVMILALTSANEAIMIRQYRHGIEQVCLELPGGLVDPQDNSPAAAAERELLEETGYGVSKIVKLGSCYPQPAVLNNKGHFFLGTQAEKVAEPTLDEGEDIEIVHIPINDVPQMIEKGEITHGMVMLAYFFYRIFHPAFI